MHWLGRASKPSKRTMSYAVVTSKGSLSCGGYEDGSFLLLGSAPSLVSGSVVNKPLKVYRTPHFTQRVFFDSLGSELWPS